MTQTFTVKQYGDELNCYTSALSQVHGKPQKLSVCGEYLYWTQGKQQELFRTLKSDVTSQTAERVIKTEDETPSSTSNAKLTKEEEMLRERTRSVVTGISNYQVRAADEAVFYLAGLDLYVYYQNGPRAGKPPLKVFDFMGPADKARLANAPNLCIAHVAPKEGEESRTDAFTVTFVNQHNLFIAEVSETPDSAETPLTLEIEQVTTIGDALHQCGAADYMIQEEFDRYTGHYANDRYVVFSYTDESAMRSITLLKSRGDVLNEEDDGEGGVEKLPYSRVGDVNASTTLVVFDRLRKSYHLIPREAIQREAPWVEYIPRFGFKDHDTVYLSALSRTQEDYAVLSCPIADLPRIKETDIAKLYRDDGDGLLSDEDVELMTTQNELIANEPEAEKDVKMTVEWRQSIPWAWVEIPPGPPILFGKEYDVLLCHAAETTTAHFHLFYRRHETEPATAEAEAEGSSTPKAQTPTTVDAEVSPAPARPPSNSTTTSVAALSLWEPLTSGPWNVKPGSVKVMADQIAFMANAHGRLAQILYTIPFPPVAAEALDESAITRLTLPQEHVYMYCFDTGAHSDRYYYTASQRRQLTQMYAGSVKEKLSDDVSTPSWLNPSSIYPCEFTTTTTQDPTATDKKFFTGPSVVQSHGFHLMGLSVVTPYVVTTNNRRGVPISAQVYVAPRYLGGERVKAPLAVFVYGGPHVQLVYENDFDGCAKPNVQVLLRHGISVAVVDGQMSNANGLRDLSICKRNMGHFETADYVDMVRYLAAPSGAPHELPPCFGVDTSRVAIFGWSYGGYATLLAMCQAPDVFKIGFAGAPVGDWKLYDTGYTERYMGVLYEDPGRPRRGSSIWRRFSQVGAGAASHSNAGREEEESVSASAAEDQTSAGSASPHSPAGASTSHVSTVLNAHGRVSKAYLNSTIEHYAKGFPEERNRVYIAHGLLDENVHFAHTSHVVSAMIKANKPVNVLVYPGERHGLRQNAQSRLHHDGVMVKTFVESLHKDEEKEKRHALYIILLGVVCVAYLFRWKYVLMIAIGALVFRH